MRSSDTSRHSPLIWFVFLVIVIDLVGFGLVIPLLPFMAPSLGGDASDVAFIMITYAVGAAVIAPLWGRLSDRAGRRFALVLALLASSAAYVVTALSDTLFQVYLGRALSGLAAGSLPVATALMADLSPPERRAKAMGLVGTAFGLGLIAGPVLGGLLTGDSESFALPFYTAAAMSFIAAIFAFWLLPAQMVISSIGSIPEPLAGIEMDGPYYAFRDDDSGVYEPLPGVFGVGNVVTGQGNIKVSLDHGKAVASFLVENYLGLGEEGERDLGSFHGFLQLEDTVGSR